MKIEDKLQMIDKLLKDDNYLDEYINKLENSKVKTPTKLKEKILTSINNIKSEEVQNISKPKRKIYLDVLKVAACLTFVLVMWQFVLSKPTVYAGSSNINKSNFYENLNGVMKNISEFFMNPFNNERSNK